MLQSNRLLRARCLLSLIIVSLIALSGLHAQSAQVLTGQAAFTDYSKEKPGTMRKVTAADVPELFATRSAENGASLIARPTNMMPEAPAGFMVHLFSSELKDPRLIRTAPNGDLFVVESEPVGVDAAGLSRCNELTEKHTVPCRSV